MILYEVLITVGTILFVSLLLISSCKQKNKPNNMVITSAITNQHSRIISLSKKILDYQSQIRFLLLKESNDIGKYNIDIKELQRLLLVITSVKYDVDYDLKTISLSSLQEIYEGLEELDEEIATEKGKVINLLKHYRETSAGFSGYRSRLPTLFASVKAKINETPYIDLKESEYNFILGVKENEKHLFFTKCKKLIEYYEAIINYKS